MPDTIGRHLAADAAGPPPPTPRAGRDNLRRDAVRAQEARRHGG